MSCGLLLYSDLMYLFIGFLVFILCSGTHVNDLLHCHDDPTYEPRVGYIEELQFTWLATLQYIHIKRGTPYYFRAPRVVLVSRQYVLCTAHDATLVPTGYALGNVVFGEYERDEFECGLTVDQVASGSPCDRVTLLMPIADVIVHPEYRTFGLLHSVALLKMLTPVVSKYMVPVCLPLRNYFIESQDQRVSTEILYHIDYATPVPRVFADETKEITIIELLPDDLCSPAVMPFMKNKERKKQQICTSGCGLNSGAPTIIHEHTGQWTIVAMSLGGSYCADPLIYQRESAPPHHLVIFPYLDWITKTITGKPAIALKTDPFGQLVPRATYYQRMAESWVGHWWLGGINCYDRGYASVGLFRFYHEVFALHPDATTNLTYYIELHTPTDVYVKCVKVGMPIQLAKPRVWELMTPTPKIRIPIRNVTYTFRFEVEAWGINMTEYPTGQNKP